MLTLFANGEKFQCDKAVKGMDFIYCYANGMITAEFNGISNFSGYSLKDKSGNNVEFSIPEPSKTDRIQAIEQAILTIMMGEM